MKTKKTYAIELEADDHYVIRLGKAKYRLTRVTATSRDRKWCWVWYEGPDYVELQQVLISALPLTLMVMVKAHVA